MSNNVNRTFLTLIWIPWRIPHRRVARRGTWVNFPRHGGKIAKKHAQKWRIFPQFSAFFQVLPNTHRSEQHRCQPSANIIANVNCEYSELITTKDHESSNFWRLYFSLYSVFPKVKFSNACLVPIATFFKHGFQISKHVRTCRHVKLGHAASHYGSSHYQLCNPVNDNSSISQSLLNLTNDWVMNNELANGDATRHRVRLWYLTVLAALSTIPWNVKSKGCNGSSSL